MAIQIRRGTNAGWEASKSNIVVGEPAVATDTERAFIGTGSGTYMELANLERIAPAYDTSVEYATGDIVSWQGELYKAIAPTSGAFNIAYWEKMTFSDILKDFNEHKYDGYETNTIEDVEIASFDNGAGDIAVKDLQVGIEAVQSGSGDPSPTNVRPISGWDEVNVNVSGVNIWDEEWEVGFISVSDGNNSPSSVNIRSKNYIPVLPNTSYYLKSSVGTVYCPIIFYDANKNFVSSVAQTVWNSVITVPSNASYMRFYMHDSYGTTYKNDISINYPSTDHDYHAYNGQTYTINLNGTRYGGTLDVTTGVLTVNKVYYELQNQTSGWSKSGTYAGGFYFSNPPQAFKINTPFLCSHAKTVTSISEYVTGTCFCDGAINIRIMDASTTLAQWQQYLADQKTAGTPVTICYELATPQTVQLTATTEVETVYKNNNIWADSGNIKVLVYRITRH